jgi:hypothetical protein
MGAVRCGANSLGEEGGKIKHISFLKMLFRAIFFKAGLSLSWLLVEKLKIRRAFKNGEMQGREKIQDAQCTLASISGLDFFADAADRRFGAPCRGRVGTR